MLRSTLLHLPGIGPVREKRLWAQGVSCWEDFAAREPDSLAGQQAQESCRRWADGDWNYFDHYLPAAEKWRAFADLRDRALYVDIETDGTDFITVIGVFDGWESRLYVAGRDLEQACAHIERHPLVITYNGALFDLPVIRKRFRAHRFNHVHLDLRYPLHRLGYKGGLKRIEQQLGIQRSDETQGLDGWAAVHLWQRWQRGDEQAGRQLLAYNEEDTRNLMPLAELVWRKMSEQTKVST
jgi:uncharacterized protein YprB with RNaseH-like and TPR domain